MKISEIPIGNVVILGVLCITGVIVIAAVLGAIFGKPLDADTRGLVGQFVTALLGLFGGLQWGQARAQAKELQVLHGK